MAQLDMHHSELLNAPAAAVYDTIADYRNGHPRILPRPFFQSLDVLEGGIGDGTRISFTTRAFGQTRTATATVHEIEPGRLLEEHGDGLKTTFTVEPRSDGQQAYVTFRTEMAARNSFERWLSQRLLRKVYHQEMQLLEQEANRLAARS